MPKLDQKPVMSAIILDLASEWINIGKTLQEREYYLDFVTKAWNIGCLPLDQREVEIQTILSLFKRTGANKKDIQSLEENMRHFISEKDKRYPTINKLIAYGQIQVNNGQESVYIASFPSA